MRRSLRRSQLVVSQRDSIVTPPSLLLLPVDALHACLLFLELRAVSVIKPVCHALCRIARVLLQDVRWQRRHISLTRLHIVLHEELVPQSIVLASARQRSGLDGAEFDTRFCSKGSWPIDTQANLEFNQLYSDAFDELLECARSWLGASALARARVCPEEAQQRSEVEINTSGGKHSLLLLPLHLAAMLKLDDAHLEAISAVHPPDATWQLADLLRAGRVGENAALERLALHPNEARRVDEAWADEADEADEANRYPSTLGGLNVRQPTCLHLACAHSPSAALLERLVSCHPQAAATRRLPYANFPLQQLFEHEQQQGRPPSSAACELLARAHPQAIATLNEATDANYCMGGSGTTLFAAATCAPLCVPMLVGLCPAAASVPYTAYDDPHAKTSTHRFDGMLPLHMACASGDLPAVRALLDVYPDGASSPDTSGLLPHHCAARNGHLGALRALMAVYPEGIRHEDGEGIELGRRSRGRGSTTKMMKVEHWRSTE